MAKTNANTLLLYRGRYIVGYIFLFVVFLSILAGIGFFVPGGLSDSELTAAVHSSNLSVANLLHNDPSSIIQAPYYLLQKASLALFGTTPIAIKLPSLLLAGVALLAFHGIVRLWFRSNVAIISSVITICSGVFLLYAQLGTPDVTYFAWTSILLLSASMLVKTKKFGIVWLLIAAIVAALSLYSPLFIYLIFGLGIVLLVHPHARFTFLDRSIWTTLLAFTLFVLLLVPLGLAVASQPSITRTLLAIPTDFSFVSLESLTRLGSHYFGFLQPVSGPSFTPIYGLGVCLLTLLGIYKLVTTKYTAKSYIVTTLLAIAIPAAIILPSAVTITLLPIMLLVTFAIDHLIRSWYRLFPRNPYARIAGLIPLAVLMLGISMPNIERFMYGYHYSASASHTFTRDPSLLSQAVGAVNIPAGTTSRNVTIIVPEKYQAFYKLYVSSLPAGRFYNFTVTSAPSGLTSTQAVISAGEFKLANDKAIGIPSRIIVDRTSEGANRFYVYNTYQKPLN